MQAIRAPWASASFLVYTGALTVLASALWLDSNLSDDYRAAAFVGWAALVFACAAACALAFRGAGRPLLAGLFAFVSVGLFAVAVGAIEDWWGWLSHDSPLHGFHWSLLLLEVHPCAHLPYQAEHLGRLLLGQHAHLQDLRNLAQR